MVGNIEGTIHIWWNKIEHLGFWWPENGKNCQILETGHFEVGFKRFQRIPDHDLKASGVPFHIKPLNGVIGQIERIAKLEETRKS